MDSNRQSWSPDNPDANPSFRKRSNYAASRKYRRHPSMSGSSSDGSPKQARSPSPDLSREDYTRSSDDGWKKKNDGRELEKDYCCSRTDKGGGDSYRHSEKQSVGSSHHHRKHDDYSRDHRHANAGERNYNRSSHSGRESRTDRRSDSRRESEYERSRDHRTDKYSQDKSYNKECRTKEGDSVALEHQKYNDSSDRVVSGRGQSNSVSEEIKTRERDSHRRSSGDYKASGTLSNEESRGHGKSFTSKGTDVVTYTSLIHGFCNLGMLKEAQQLLSEMQERGCAPNDVTYNVLINGLSKKRRGMPLLHGWCISSPSIKDRDLL